MMKIKLFKAFLNSFKHKKDIIKQKVLKNKGNINV